MPARNTTVSCLSLLMATIGFSGASAQQVPARITSPNEAVELVITSSQAGRPASSSLRYRVSYRGQPVIVDSALGLEIEGQPLSGHWKQVGVKANEGDETYRVPAGKSNPIRDRYRSMQIDYVEDGGPGRMLSIEARAYDDGVAFRYLIPEQRDLQDIRVTRERTEFRFAKDATTYPLILRNYTTSYEDEYQMRPLSGLHPEWLIGLPLLAELPGRRLGRDHGGPHRELRGHVPQPRRPARSLSRPGLRARPDDPKWRRPAERRSELALARRDARREPGRLDRIQHRAQPEPALGDRRHLVDQARQDVVELVVGQLRRGRRLPTRDEHRDDQALHRLLGRVRLSLHAHRRGLGRRAARGPRPDDLTAVNPAIDMPEILRAREGEECQALALGALDCRSTARWTRLSRCSRQWGIAGVKIDFMDRDDQWMVELVSPRPEEGRRSITS